MGRVVFGCVVGMILGSLIGLIVSAPGEPKAFYLGAFCGLVGAIAGATDAIVDAIDRNRPVTQRLAEPPT